jgi:MFS family permease
MSNSMSRYQWLLVALLAGSTPRWPIVRCCCVLRSRRCWWPTCWFTFTPLYLIQVRGFDQRQMSWIMSSFGVASMAVAFLVPGSSDRFGRKPVIIVASLLGLVLPLGLLFTGGRQLVPLMACIAVGAALSGVFQQTRGALSAQSLCSLSRPARPS